MRQLSRIVVLVGGSREERIGLARAAFSIYSEADSEASMYVCSYIESGEMSADASAVLCAGRMRRDLEICGNVSCGVGDVVFATEWYGFGALDPSRLSDGVSEACYEVFDDMRGAVELVGCCGEEPVGVVDFFDVAGLPDFSGRPDLLVRAIWG